MLRSGCGSATKTRAGSKLRLRNAVGVGGQCFEDKCPRILIDHKSEEGIATCDNPKDSPVFDELPKLQDAKWVSVSRLNCDLRV